ncbi:MAG TPA: HEAT repeat domain-containing protein [Candidatus Dormibacteraeota bacterium]|nr:HEAT repeat domain-containing protein [Candidatus Dormibacteraeota bacterium]HEX2681178.1 HEAT repeat domain-containing protein [Candidatus Dormibacteraeota bacterium]
MSEKVESYRAELRRLKEWEPYLKRHSGLPGPRANLELVQAVGEEADADRLWRLSASQDEFLALCGTAGLGRIALLEPETVMKWLRELASDPRWRVREGVAIALQRYGSESMPKLIEEMKEWSRDGAYVQRAAIAALCEPPLLKSNEDAVEALVILDHVTRSMAATSDRRSDAFKVLRKALGYCWSVAAAAAPLNARPYLEKWLRSKDKDVAWVMKSNLAKARMAPLRKLLVSKPAPGRRSVSRAKSKPAAARSSRSTRRAAAARPRRRRAT